MRVLSKAILSLALGRPPCQNLVVMAPPVTSAPQQDRPQRGLTGLDDCEWLTGSVAPNEHNIHPGSLGPCTVRRQSICFNGNA